MRHSSHHVLVVDDDRDLARTVGDILQVHGYRSMVANTGSQSLDILSSHPDPFPVALVDLKLPDMDGLELVGRLQEVTALTQVVILTGNASLDSAVAALRERSYDYLVKPVPPRELVQTVREGLQRWHHQNAEDELRKDRERFKLLVEALSEIVTVVAPDLTVEYQSPSALHAIGYGPGELSGTSFLDLVHESDSGAVAIALTEVRESSGQEAALEFRMRKADGTWCLMEGTARGLLRRRGAPVVVTCRDITERRRLEDDLRQSQKMESMGRLAGGVAHDFNNQLTAILSAVDLAEFEPEVAPTVREELGEIRKAAHRAARLTQQLLVFSRRGASEPRRVAVNEVAEGMRSMLHRLIPTRIELATELGRDLPAVTIDPDQLEQVMMNLVVNARDALGERPGRIVLRTSKREVVGAQEEEGIRGTGRMVVLEVEDDGEGMSDEVIRRVFEPFFTTKEKAKGTGLGLATCYGIVTHAGGSIRVASTPGEGTTFQVILPATEGAPEPLAEADGATPGDQGQGETILLVEDDDAVRRVFARILGNHGYRVITAPGGAEALRQIQSEKVHLLLTDLVMPGLSGPQVARNVRAEDPGVRVLFTSGYAGEDIAPGGHLPFGGELVRKPVESAELLRQVRSVLDAPPA